MAEIYPLGQNRIFYKTRTFPVPKEITVNLINPDLDNNTNIKLTPVDAVSGLFYFEAIFSKEGTYIAIFYENGEEKTSQAFSTRRLPTVSEGGGFRSFLGDNVINT